MLLFFNMSGGEILVIFVFILLFFGSGSIPGIARSLGQGIRQFKDATQDIQRDIENNTRDFRNKIQEETKEFRTSLTESESQIPGKLDQSGAQPKIPDPPAQNYHEEAAKIIPDQAFNEDINTKPSS